MIDFSVHKFPYSEISQFSKFDKLYAGDRSSLTPFYKWEPTLDQFKNIQQEKSKHDVDRSLLVRSLLKQYEAITEVSEQLKATIQSLEKESVYTIVTAHQPSLCTGPLYFVSKAASVIALAREINKKYTDFQVVPVFVIGGEDHDFEEINHFHFQGQTIEWLEEQGGAVGRYHTETLRLLLKEFKKQLGTSDTGMVMSQKILDPYFNHDNYALATQQILHNLFGEEGLVVLSMDEPEMKAKMVDIFWDDLENHSSEKLVHQTQKELASLGLKSQAMARSINLFYLEENHRYRIDQEANGSYYLVNTNRHFSAEQLKSMLTSDPGDFSPNVVLRPLYQESILPNLAYVGGGGELAYWMERKNQFQHYEIPFPMLIRRDSSQWMRATEMRQLDNWSLGIETIWQSQSETRDHLLHTMRGQNWDLSNEKEQIESIFKSIESKISPADPTLSPYSLGLGTMSSNFVSKIEKKWARAIRRKESDIVRQTEKFYDSIYPKGKLQERYTNYMDLCLDYGEELIPAMIKNFSPLDMEMKVFSPQDSADNS